MAKKRAANRKKSNPKARASTPRRSRTPAPRSDLRPLLIDSTTDYAIFTLNRTGRIQSWNPGAERMTGYRPAEMVGEHFARLFPAEEVQAGKPERLLRSAAADGRIEDESGRQRKDGSLFRAHV